MLGISLISKLRSKSKIIFNITNKFLQYMSRMECDVPGVEIAETPEQTNGSLVTDISKIEEYQKAV